MIVTKRITHILIVAVACAVASGARADNGSGGGPIRFDLEAGAIPPADQALADSKIKQYVERFGPLSRFFEGEPAPPLEVFPLAGVFWRDIIPLNYVDLDPTPGVLDWNCGDRSEDAHHGTDVVLRTFAEQDIGVPVVAAQDGIVVAVHDGEPDQNVSGGNLPSNFIIIDHGLGREGWYWHLRRNSVDVQVGQTVAAGQQIAQAGSSGNSKGPHLHFEVHQGGEVVDPFAGPCRPGGSLWRNQPPLNAATIINDFGISTEFQTSFAPWPARWPTTGQITVDDPFLRVWFLGASLPANSNWLVRFRRPDGTYKSGFSLQNFGNSTTWRTFNWWYTYPISEIGMQTGTWYVQLFVNGELQVEAPFTVTSSGGSVPAHAPEPISVSLEPPQPVGGRPVQCIVETPMVIDDLDYDIVRYHYIWSVNGNVVRRITTAAQSDCLAARWFDTSDLVLCGVTTTDGSHFGSTTIVAVPASQPSVPAIGEWGVVALALLLLSGGTIVLRRRTRVA